MHRKVFFKSLFSALLILLLSLMLYHYSEVQSNDHITQEIKHLTENIANEFSIKITDLTNAQKRMARRWETRKGTPKHEFESDAKQYIKDHIEFQALEWVNANGIVEWIIPIEGNESVIGWDNKKNQDRWKILSAAKNNKKLTLSDPINLLQGGKGILAFEPIVYDKKFDGYILAVYRFEGLAQPIFDSSKDRLLSRVDLFFDDAYVFKTRSDIPYNDQFSSKVNKTILGKKWTFELSPSRKLIRQHQSYLSLAILLFGLFSSILVAVTVYLSSSKGRHRINNR